MRSSSGNIRYVLVLGLILLAVPGAAGFSLQSSSVMPNTPQVAPGTEITAKYILYFDSWMTGSTIDSDHSIVMYTDLVDPKWVASKVEEAEENAASRTEQILSKQGAIARIDGWAISYESARFSVYVTLTGKAPSPAQTRSVTLIKVEERNGDADLVSGSQIKKEITVAVPVQQPPAVVTTATPPPPVETIVVTLVPQSPAVPSTPTRKVTYSPGPEPLLIISLLAGLVVLLRSVQSR